ncbi:MAG TPA: NUDIX domain-containing protein [Acetobacteraceae bacterium]|nr:NUDIX domain-containing protein [Acetobacteraceae bacterium]
MSRPPPPALPDHPDLDIISDDRVWDGRFPLDRVRFRHRRFDGALSGVRTWELWRRGRAAAMLPYDPVKDVVILIEQFRLPALAAGLDPILTELPAGLCDGAEPPEATIRREVQEEMGLRAGRLIKISDVLLTPGGADELCALFVGEIAAPEADSSGLCGHAGLAHEDEDIRLRAWPARRAIDAALEGHIANSVAAIALLWFQARREWVRSAWGAA